MKPNTVNLTKVLFVGDKVWTLTGQEATILQTSPNKSSTFMIEFNGMMLWVNKFGYLNSGDKYCFVYPNANLDEWADTCPYTEGERVWRKGHTGSWYPAYFKERTSYIHATINSQFGRPSNVLIAHLRKFEDCPIPQTDPNLKSNQ